LCFCFCGKRFRGRCFFVLFVYLVVAVELGSERSSLPGMSDDEDDAQEMARMRAAAKARQRSDAELGMENFL
jgi:hypothetical protein